jgi:hypothetical protein
MAGSSRAGPLEAAPGPLGRVEVHPGTGVVLRRGTLLLVVPVVEETQRHAVDELLRSCAEAGDPGDTGDPGDPGPLRDRRLVDRLARLVTQDTTHRLPGFAAVVGRGDGLLVMTHGPVPVLVDGRDQGFSSATGPLEWVERSVAATFTSLSIGQVGETPAGTVGDSQGHPGAALALDLVDGSVPAGGVTLHLAGGTGGSSTGALHASAGVAPAGAAGRSAASMTVLRAAPQTRVVSLAPRPGDPSRTRSPLPVGAPGRGGSGHATEAPGATVLADAGPVLVTGVVCTCGELNSPDAEACPACGAPLDRTLPRRSGPRPPLGILITDDGRVFTLTDDVVVGREPAQAAEVRSGRARPLVLRDTDQSTSRVHAEIRLSGWRVDVVDRGSSNGTFLSRSGPAGPWLPVPQGDGLALAPGDRLRLGKRELLFDRYQAFRVRS